MEYRVQQEERYREIQRGFWCGEDDPIKGKEACWKKEQAEKAQAKKDKRDQEAALRARYGGKLPQWYKDELAREKADRERGEIRIVVDDY
jgi:hypothetical protein